MRTLPPIQRIGLLGLIIGFTACGIVDPHQAAKTYPDALELERVSLQALKETAPAPASYNLEVYVISRNICGACCKCIIPDGILIAESRNPELPEEGLRLAATAPRQFEIGYQYVMSVEVREENFYNQVTGKPVRRVKLLGYNQAK